MHSDVIVLQWSAYRYVLPFHMHSVETQEEGGKLLVIDDDEGDVDGNDAK